MVLTRGHGEALETFWVLRSDAVRYMPGFRAFPGGIVNPEDRTLAIDGLEEGLERTLMACALRETFEETGVLLARGSHPVAELAAARLRLLGGETRFPDLARERGWRFDSRDLVAAGRWISPPFAPARFETTYFLAHVPAGQEPAIEPGELTSGEWVSPVAALRRWHAGTEAFAAPVLYTLIELGQGEEGVADRMATWPESSGRPVRRIELSWGIVLHPMKTRPLPPATHTNAYLVGEREMAIVDPGSGDPAELDALFGLIELLGGDQRKPKIVLLTHHHPDHLGGLDAVRERYRVPVAAHPETARHVRVDFTLEDGEWIPLLAGDAGDWNLMAVHTPGHARGHLCFFHPRTRSLLSGDHVVGGQGTVIVDPPEGDMGDYLRSLDRLLGLRPATLFPGHGAPQGAASRRIGALIEHRLAREAKVLAALSAEPEPLEALVPRAYDDTPRELWGYAARSLLAHLLKLEAQGRAARTGESWRAAGLSD